MHDAPIAYRLHRFAGTQRATLDPHRASRAAVRPGSLHFHIGLLNGYWSLESGHWSADAVRQKFPCASSSRDRALAAQQTDETSSERRLLRAATNMARIDYRTYGTEQVEHSREVIG